MSSVIFLRFSSSIMENSAAKGGRVFHYYHYLARGWGDDGAGQSRQLGVSDLRAAEAEFSSAKTVSMHGNVRPPGYSFFRPCSRFVRRTPFLPFIDV